MRTCEHSSTLKVHSRHTTPPKGINTTHANPKAALTPFSAHARRPRSRRGSSRPILVEPPGRMPPSPTAATTEPVCSSKGGSSCAPCESLDRSHLLSPVEVEAALETDLRMWRATETPSDGDGDGTPSVPGISRKFTALNFQCAMDSLNAFGAIAEREGHHPDFHLTGYRNVEVKLFTHSLCGVSGNDLSLAKMLDREVKVQYSPKWLRSHPEASDR